MVVIISDFYCTLIYGGEDEAVGDCRVNVIRCSTTAASARTEAVNKASIESIVVTEGHRRSPKVPRDAHVLDTT